MNPFAEVLCIFFARMMKEFCGSWKREKNGVWKTHRKLFCRIFTKNGFLAWLGITSRYLRNSLQIATAFHGFKHGDFVGVLEISADGNTHADARDARAEWLEELGEIDGGGFAFGSWIRGDDDFFDGAAFETLDQRFYMELLGATTLKGRKRTAENVVHAGVGARFFDGENVVGFLHDTDRALVAGGAGAVEAGVRVGDVVAGRAGSDFFLGVANGVGEPESVFGSGTENVECEALGGLLANAGEML